MTTVFQAPQSANEQPQIKRDFHPKTAQNDRVRVAIYKKQFKNKPYSRTVKSFQEF